MKTISAKRFSVLGITLMAASAITAALVPSNSKADAARFAQNGDITASTDGQITCQPRDVINGELEPANCWNTLTGNGSDTSVNAQDVSAENATTGNDEG